jgi:hypothetical protein
MKIFVKLNPEDILRWLEDAVRLTWESKKDYLDKEFVSSKDILNGK